MDRNIGINMNENDIRKYFHQCRVHLPLLSTIWLFGLFELMWKCKFKTQHTWKYIFIPIFFKIFIIYPIIIIFTLLIYMLITIVSMFNYAIRGHCYVFIDIRHIDKIDEILDIQNEVVLPDFIMSLFL